MSLTPEVKYANHKFSGIQLSCKSILLRIDTTYCEAIPWDKNSENWIDTSQYGNSRMYDLQKTHYYYLLHYTTVYNY